jgi:hypothetical protein
MTNSDNSEFPVEMNVGGDLSDYVKLSEYEFVLGPRGTKTLNFTLSLPEWIEPGRHMIAISGMQKVPPVEHGIVARMQVGYRFFVFSPYPGKYIVFTVGIENAKVNETVKFTIDGVHRGNVTVQSAQAMFYVYDSEGNLITSLSSDKKSVEPGEKVNFASEWLATNVKPGKHKLVADLLYDGNKTEKTMDFMIGSPTVKINNVLVNPIVNGTIGKITVNVASEWDELIKDMYVSLDFSKGGAWYTTKSNSFDLDKFKEDNITVFWDTSNSEGPGKYTGLATLYYLNKTYNTTFYAEITEAGMGPQTLTILLIAAIAILVALPLLMLIIRKRKKKGLSQKKLM